MNKEQLARDFTLLQLIQLIKNDELTISADNVDELVEKYKHIHDNFLENLG